MMRKSSGNCRSICVGCTGMLAGAMRFMARECEVISFSRGRIKTSRSDNIVAHHVDFNCRGSFEEISLGIRGALPVKRVLIWVHSRFHPSILEVLAGFDPVVVGHVVQVFGTSTASVALSPGEIRRSLPRLSYNFVLLGANSTGWLSHEEISAAAVRAFTEKIDIVAGALK